MPNLPIDPERAEWTYLALTEDYEYLSMIEDLEPSAGPSPWDAPRAAADDEIDRVAEDLDDDRRGLDEG